MARRQQNRQARMTDWALSRVHVRSMWNEGLIRQLDDCSYNPPPRLSDGLRHKVTRTS